MLNIHVSMGPKSHGLGKVSKSHGLLVCAVVCRTFSQVCLRLIGRAQSFTSSYKVLISQLAYACLTPSWTYCSSSFALPSPFF